MNPTQPIYHLALVTLEALSAHGVQSGEADFIQDVVLLRDANGLPTIAGTSIAGVLRHLYQARFGKNATDSIFGFANKGSAQSSGVHINWALVHDSNNNVIEGLRENTNQDAVLYELGQPHPIVRQRVRLDARGTAEDAGKFDVSLIPAGVRYSTLIGFWSGGSIEEEQAWHDMLGLLHSPFFRLGHGTRAGAGAFKVQALHAERWDLRTDEGKAGYMTRPRSRLAARALPKLNLPTNEHSLAVELNLKSEAGWRIGGGDVPVGFSQDESPDMLPQTEWRIEWQGEQAKVGQRLNLLPATSVKGALVHRFAFHYRCLSGNWVGESGPEAAHTEQAVKDLFGYAGERDDEGQAGLVFIDDLYLDTAQTATQMHNRIDQFTGGVMTGALFEEGLLWQTPITLNLQFQNNECLQNLTSNHREALKRTLEDLCEGRLPLGASGSRGQGVFIATQAARWTDAGKWIEQGEQA